MDDLLPTPRVKSTANTSILVNEPHLNSLILTPYIPISTSIPNFRFTFLKFANNAITIQCCYEFLPQLTLETHKKFTIGSIFDHIVLGVHFSPTLEHMRLFNVYIYLDVFVEGLVRMSNLIYDAPDISK